MKATNLQDRIKVCREVLGKTCMAGIAVELDLLQAKHLKNDKRIEELECISKEFQLIANLLEKELDRLNGVHTYHLN
jgi:hypothetical protein